MTIHQRMAVICFCAAAGFGAAFCGFKIAPLLMACFMFYHLGRLAKEVANG